MNWYQRIKKYSIILVDLLSYFSLKILPVFPIVLSFLTILELSIWMLCFDQRKYWLLKVVVTIEKMLLMAKQNFQ